MPAARHILAAVMLAASAAATAAANGPGLTVSPDAAPWPRWQARLLLTTTSPLWRDGSTTASGLGSPSTSLGVLGDYYLGGALSGPSRAGGFRATSGIVVGSISQALTPTGRIGSVGTLSFDRRVFGQLPAVLPGDASVDTPTLPYLGFGYTGLSARSGWSFSADLGLVSRSPGGGLKLAGVLAGSQSLDDKVRDMRWAPVVQLGISYAF